MFNRSHFTLKYEVGIHITITYRYTAEPQDENLTSDDLRH